MKPLLALIFATTLVTCTTASGRGGGGGSHYVAPHVTKSGTYVQGHYQSNPNDSKADNWSSKGNLNPYTGETGKAEPTPTYVQPLSPSPAMPASTIRPPSLDPKPLVMSPVPKAEFSAGARSAVRPTGRPINARSPAMKSAFVRSHPCPSTGRTLGSCPGYVVDHVNPLCAGGRDLLSNMQWQTVAEAKRKDVAEAGQCAALRR